MLTASEVKEFASPPMPVLGRAEFQPYGPAPIFPWTFPRRYETEPEAAPANDNPPPVLSALVDIADLPGFAYMGTPYTNYPGGRDEAFRLAAAYAGALMRRGVKVFSPIAHSHPIAREGGIDETDHDIWVEADAPFVAAATSLIVVMMDGWAESRGLQHEIDAFIAAHKPILYIRTEDLS